MAEYIKDNKKSLKPTSIRFNEVRLKIAMAKSGKKGRQQFIDWLIDWYVNGENPIIERQQQVYDASPIKINYDEPKQWQEPTQVQQPLDKVGVLYQIIGNCETAQDFKNAYKAIDAAKLNYQVRGTVLDFWDKAKEKKGFIYND